MSSGTANFCFFPRPFPDSPFRANSGCRDSEKPLSAADSTTITVISPEASSEREISVSADSYEFQSGRRMMAETLEKGLEASITAIICVNDMTAYGAMVALKQHGIRIPQDVSLVDSTTSCPPA